MCYNDLRKAFDTVNHHSLLQKLEQYGIGGLPLQLLKSDLINRTQYTVVNNYKSTYNLLTCGVPEGFTLRPLLFLVYVNDLPLASKFNSKLFANDTVLTLLNACIQTLSNNVNCELAKIVDIWMKINKLFINYEKTKFMLSSKKIPINYQIFIGPTKLKK